MTAAERALTLSRRMSPIGLGTARGAEDGATDARMTDILSAGLGHGVTVLDTAVNYRRGRSERAVGEALRRAIALGVTSRDRVVVSTKVGYPRPDGGVASSAPGPESHDPTTYCLDPRCIRYSLATSLETIGVDRIDLCFIHNPEEVRRNATDVGPCLLRAVEALETAVADGLILGYGFATWDLDEDLEVLNPVRFAELAISVAGREHHFAAVQAPLSLHRREALRPRYLVDGKLVSLVSLCARLGLVFVASATAGGGHTAGIAASSVRWAASVPGVTTALVGTLQMEHLLAVTGAGIA